MTQIPSQLMHFLLDCPRYYKVFKLFLPSRQNPKTKRRPPKATKVRFESFCKRVQEGQQKHGSKVVCLHNLLSGHKTCLFGLLRLLPNASFFNFRTKLVYQLGCPDNFVSICFISHLTVSNLACNQSFFLDNPCNTQQGICNL